MRILITGGAGFIGHHLIGSLLDDGQEVWAVDNLITGKKSNLKNFLPSRRFAFYRLAIEDPRFLKFFFGKQFNQIYHLACATGVPNIQKLGEEMLLACSLGTWNVLRLAKKTRAKFLFTSSSEIYGQPLKFPQAESYAGNVDPLGPRANYEEGKRFSETLVKWFAEKYALNARIIRLFNVYGPGMSLDDFRVAPRFFRQAILNQPLTVHGRGKQRRTFCYISDIAAGLKLVMRKGRAGEAYNLGGWQEISISALAKTVKRIVRSTSRIVFTSRPPKDHSAREPDLSKIRALGWRQSVGLKQGLTITGRDFQRRLAQGRQ